MKLPKETLKAPAAVASLKLEIDKTLVDQLNVMESHTGISKEELLSTALKRFISAHKDYFPEDYKA